MNLGQFVSTSAVVLAGWLGFTFVHDVPVQRYPKHDRYAVIHEEPAQAAVGGGGVADGDLQVSVSR